MESLQKEFINQIICSAVREYEIKYSGALEATRHCELQMQKLGNKPGFSMIDLLIPTKTNIGSLTEIKDFLATKFCQNLFEVQCEVVPGKAQEVFSFKFQGESLPDFLKRLGPFDKISEKQRFWQRAYCFFILGVFEGALLHLGYKAVASLTNDNPGVFILNFIVEKNSGNWSEAVAHIPNNSL